LDGPVDSSPTPVRQARACSGVPAHAEDATFCRLWRDVALAIVDGRIRSAAEQKLAFERSQARRPKKAARRGRPPRVTVTEDNRIRIGKTAVDAERVIAVLREHGLID